MRSKRKITELCGIGFFFMHFLVRADDTDWIKV
jgi:heme/copper-type cytochrome/quinol oxidase subunit 2